MTVREISFFATPPTLPCVGNRGI